MYLRDAINSDEVRKLVDAVRGGLTWDEVRGILPGVDPAALDRGWKIHILRMAGKAPEEPPVRTQPSKR